MVMPESTSSSALWPLPGHPGHSEDLGRAGPAARCPSGAPRRWRRPGTARARRWRPRPAPALRAGSAWSRASGPTMSSASSPGLVSDVSRCATISPSRNTDTDVGDVHDLAQLVRDEDDGGAPVAQRAQHAKELIGLLRRQHAGWARRGSGSRRGGRAPSGSRCVAARPTGKRPASASRCTDSPYSSASRASSCARVRRAGRDQRVLLRTQHDVLEHAERVHQHEVLMGPCRSPSRWHSAELVMSTRCPFTRISPSSAR